MIVLSACMPTRFVNGWVPYWNATRGPGRLHQSARRRRCSTTSRRSSSAPNPTARSRSSARRRQLTATVDAAHAQGLTVLPSITDGSGKWMMATVILADPTQPDAARAEHRRPRSMPVGSTASISTTRASPSPTAATRGPTTQPVWVAFVTELAAALHAQGKLLSVTIPPTWVEAGGVARLPGVRPGSRSARSPTASG